MTSLFYKAKKKKPGSKFLHDILRGDFLHIFCGMSPPPFTWNKATFVSLYFNDKISASILFHSFKKTGEEWNVSFLQM